MMVEKPANHLPVSIAGKWRSVRLGDIAGLLPSKSVASDGDARVAVITTACLSETGFAPAGVKEARMRSEDVALSKVRSGEILVARSNTPELVGRAAIFRGEVSDVVASDLTIRLWPRDGFDGEFLSRFLTHLFLTGYWRERASGASGTMKKITRGQLENLCVPVPPLATQQRIAARLREQLAAVAEARAALAAQLAAAEALPAAHLRAVFQSPDAQRWPVRRLGDLGEIVGGIQKQPDRAPVKFHKAFLTVRNVQHGYLDLSRVERFEVTPAEFARCRLQRGDLLIVEGNGSLDHIGRNALFNEDGEWIHQNHIIRVRLPSAPLSPEFVSHYLNSETGRAQLIEKARSTTGLYTLSAGKIASLEIPTPSPTRQTEIVSSLNAEYAATDALRTALAAKLADVEKLPAALLRAAFSGTESDG